MELLGVNTREEKLFKMNNFNLIKNISRWTINTFGLEIISCNHQNRIFCSSFPTGVARAINQTSFKMKHVSEIKNVVYKPLFQLMLAKIQPHIQ